MPNFTTLATDEREAIEKMRDTLREQSDALQTLLTAGYSDDLRRTLRDACNMLGEYRPVVSKELPGILERLRDGRCPDCWGVEGVCDCDNPSDMASIDEAA